MNGISFEKLIRHPGPLFDYSEFSPELRAFIYSLGRDLAALEFGSRWDLFGLERQDLEIAMILNGVEMNLFMRIRLKDGPSAAQGPTP